MAPIFTVTALRSWDCSRHCSLIEPQESVIDCTGVALFQPLCAQRTVGRPLRRAAVRRRPARAARATAGSSAEQRLERRRVRRVEEHDVETLRRRLAQERERVAPHDPRRCGPSCSAVACNAATSRAVLLDEPRLRGAARQRFEAQHARFRRRDRGNALRRPPRSTSRNTVSRTRSGVGRTRCSSVGNLRCAVRANRPR